MIQQNDKFASLINDENQLTIDLFHGTSTLFLDSIIQNGLGGINPVNEWKLLDICREVYDLSEQHLKESELYKVSLYSFKKMTEQSNEGSFNFQHGESYLSPSSSTACRYAINKQYGSEILTYTIKFLKALIEKKITYVTKDLFHKYPKIFGLIEARPSPLLIQINNVNSTSLLDEHGNDPKIKFEILQEWLSKDGSFFNTLSQQMNFRLTKPIQIGQLKFWLINVTNWKSHLPEYNLYEIQTSRAQ